MEINIVSVKQLRESFGQIKEGIENGQSYLLIYRSRPLAEIKPLEKGRELKLIKEKRVRMGIEKVRKLAGGLNLGKGLTPKQTNALYSRTYENLLS